MDDVQDDIQKLSRLLETHVAAYINLHDHEDVKFPVKAAPLEPIVELAKVLNVFNKTVQHPGVRLYRGYKVHAHEIVGFTVGKLDLDRITSFTPYLDTALTFGTTVVCIELDSLHQVFADDTPCSGICRSTEHPCNVFPGKKIHTGDLGCEVQLMPGQYKILSLRFDV